MTSSEILPKSKKIEYLEFNCIFYYFLILSKSSFNRFLEIEVIYYAHQKFILNHFWNPSDLLRLPRSSFKKFGVINDVYLRIAFELEVIYYVHENPHFSTT